eukprot:4196907-Pleurochrysis_carterae.AAC.1
MSTQTRTQGVRWHKRARASSGANVKTILGSAFDENSVPSSSILGMTRPSPRPAKTAPST